MGAPQGSAPHGAHHFRPPSHLLLLPHLAAVDESHHTQAELPRVDGVIMTNYYDRSKLSGNALVETIAKSGKPLAIVTNTPYPALSIPDSVDCALVTFCCSPESLRAAAAVLFGKTSAEGVWPITFQIPK